MAYIVTDNCVDCKFTDCVMVCPVDCFFDAPEDSGYKMLVIHADECIDCGACVPECPVEAIYSEDEIPDGQEDWIEKNKNLAYQAAESGAEAVTEERDPLPGAEEKKQSLGF